MDDQSPAPAPQAPAEVVENVLDPLIQRLPREEQQVVRRAIIQAVSYQGPLPPPVMMAQYNEAVPNGADRIMRQFESETAHRHSLETRALDAQIGRVNRGQWMAFFLTILFGGAGVYLALNGHPTVAGVLFTGTIASLAVAFLTGRAPPSPPSAHEEADEPSPESPKSPEKLPHRKRSRR